MYVKDQVGVVLFGWGVPELISPPRFGGVVQQIQPRYDAAASLAATASLVRACSNIIAKSIDGGEPRKHPTERAGIEPTDAH